MRSLIGCLLLTLAAPSLAAEPVLIAYRDKPPYTWTDHGKPAGQLLDKTVAAFARAGVPLRFEEMPSKRIAMELLNNSGPVCSPGWYKLPERESLANFTRPIYRDPPQVVLASTAAAARIRAHRSVKSLLNDRALRLAVVDEISYGPELDAMIKHIPRKPLGATVTSLQLSKMVAAERADYMLIDQDDLDYLRASNDFAGLEPIHFADMPKGLFRYLWCSKQVDAATLGRIDNAISQLGYDSSR